MRLEGTKGKAIWVVGGVFFALVLAGGCASKKKSALDKVPTPKPKSKPLKVDLTDIRNYARDLKHEGIVNKKLVQYLVSVGN